jgi:hypothetical protein
MSQYLEHSGVYLDHTWPVSVGFHSSNRRKRPHSTAPIRCFWSAFLVENVCTVMFGQSGRWSRCKRRRLVTKSLMSEVARGLLHVVLVFVLTDKLREWPFVVVPVAEEVCEVERDMLQD